MRGRFFGLRCYRVMGETCCNARNLRSSYAVAITLRQAGVDPFRSPWYTCKKNGRRYRYYVPQRDAKEHAGGSGLPRLPAAELESAVMEQLRAILRSPTLLADVVPQAKKLDPSLDEGNITVAMSRLDAIWDQLFPVEQSRIVKLLVEKVIVSPNDLEVRLHANGVERLALEMGQKPVTAQEPAEVPA